jgi:hypothetical protein
MATETFVGIRRNLKLARTHRFAEGDLTKHRDSTDHYSNKAEVEALTFRLVGDTLYPTYTLYSFWDGESFEDIADNDDLEAWPA